MSLEIETVFRRRAHSRGILLSALGFLAAELRRYWHRRATNRALSGLNRSELRDIGLERTEHGYRQLHPYQYGRNEWT